jgi:hypothetical protein
MRGILKYRGGPIAVQAMARSSSIFWNRPCSRFAALDIVDRRCAYDFRTVSENFDVPLHCEVGYRAARPRRVERNSVSPVRTWRRTETHRRAGRGIRRRRADLPRGGSVCRSRCRSTGCIARRYGSRHSSCKTECVPAGTRIHNWIRMRRYPGPARSKRLRCRCCCPCSSGTGRRRSDPLPRKRTPVSRRRPR